MRDPIIRTDSTGGHHTPTIELHFLHGIYNGLKVEAVSGRVFEEGPNTVLQFKTSDGELVQLSIPCADSWDEIAIVATAIAMAQREEEAGFRKAEALHAAAESEVDHGNG